VLDAHSPHGGSRRHRGLYGAHQCAGGGAGRDGDRASHALFAFGRALADIPEVLEALLVSGDYDYILRIAVSDTRDYERLLRERLYKIPGLRHSKSSFVLRSLKQSALPLRR
jgi:Lrp/AsnC family leucine-responsive transcriptional regulator